jgi:hypothetical protein
MISLLFEFIFLMEIEILIKTICKDQITRLIIFLNANNYEFKYIRIISNYPLSYKMVVPFSIILCRKVY